MQSWELLQLAERARLIVALFPTLEPDVAQKTIGEWSKGEYPDNWDGEQRAMDDLMMMLRNASMSDEQRTQERHRIATLVKDKLK